MEQLRIIHLEDDALDAELVQTELQERWPNCQILRVEGEAAFQAALSQPCVDLILCDYSLPGFDGIRALAMARQHCPSVPFIYVSGAIGEERAIESLKAGATDYVLKQRLERLVPAVQRALTEARERRQRQRAEEELRLLTQTLEDRVARRTAELHRHQQQLRSLASELTMNLQREQRRLATALHDHLAQLLASCRMRLAAVHAVTPASAQAIREVSDLLAQAIQHTRHLMQELSPPLLYDLGLVPALEWLAEQAPARHGLTVHFVDDAQDKPLSDDVRALLFHAVQELLANIARHAHTKEAWVSLARQEAQVRVSVEDRGLGFDVARLTNGGGHDQGLGLFNIRERLDLLGGKLEVLSTPGQGTRVVLTAPLAPTTGKP